MVTLYRQGGINFILNEEPKSHAAYFAQEHGPCAAGMAFRVKDSHLAYERALELGAQPIEIPTGPMELRLPAIKGIGGAPLYLIDRYTPGNTIYDIDFEFFDGVERHPEGCGFTEIDHLTHNVYRGRMEYWAKFYEDLFNFREIRYFDIKGEYTGLLSKAMTAPDGKIRIPLNEEASKGTGQIEEFLMQYNGEGIQHIALICDDLLACWDRLKERGVPFMTPPPENFPTQESPAPPQEMPSSPPSNSKNPAPTGPCGTNASSKTGCPSPSSPSSPLPSPSPRPSSPPTRRPTRSRRSTSSRNSSRSRWITCRLQATSRRVSLSGMKTGSRTECLLAGVLLLFVCSLGWTLLPECVKHAHRVVYSALVTDAQP